MRLLLAAHRNPYKEPNGAEYSMQYIVEWLQNRGHRVDVMSRTKGDLSPEAFDKRIKREVGKYNVVLTWAQAAPPTAKACVSKDVPYVLMVRWYRLVQPLPPGRLFERAPDRKFVEKHKWIFDHAKEIVTNTEFSADAIKRFYERKAKVSYVPIRGEENNVWNPNGFATIINPNRNLGEWEVIRRVAKDRKVMVVGANEKKNIRNVIHLDRTEDISGIFEKTRVLLLPLYYNDICGTSRVTIEALQHGVPVLSNRASGIDEWLPDEWLDHWDGGRIGEEDNEKALSIWNAYKAQQEDSLLVFKEAIE